MLPKEKHSDFQQFPCPLCGNEDLESLSRKGQYELPANVSICPNDGLVFLGPRWTKERYQYFYAKEYDSYFRPNVFEEDSDELKYKHIKEVKRRLDEWTSIDPKSILDIGAGMGWSLEYLKRHYTTCQRITAIESSEYCVRNLKENIGADVLAMDVDSEWKKNTGKYDLVIMRHVLEHFLDPIGVLEKVEDSLLENGIVYIAVPNMMNLKGSLNNYWYRVVHTFYFSETTLKRIADLAGLHSLVLKEGPNSELWGIFSKSNGESPISCENVYELQMSVIKNHKKKLIMVELMIWMKRIISRIIRGHSRQGYNI